jgi:soluble lytic murein transglycosylase-like protein
MSSKKKPEPKAQQEPPAEQEQPEAPMGYAVADSIPLPDGRHEVAIAPMAATAPSIEDRVAALEMANIELEKRLKKHEEYHFGRPAT